MFKKAFQKLIIIALTFLPLFPLTNCSSDENLTEPKTNTEIVGIWKVSKMSWLSPSESGTYFQTQLDSLGFIWQLTFNADKTAEQMINIEGPTIVQNCTWSTKGEVLTLTINGPSTGSIDFKHEIANNILIFNWSMPAGTQNTAEFTKQ